MVFFCNNMWPGLQNSTMWVQITLSYECLFWMWYAISVNFYSSDRDFTLLVHILLVQRQKSWWYFCVHMVDFRRPGHIKIKFFFYYSKFPQELHWHFIWSLISKKTCLCKGYAFYQLSWQGDLPRQVRPWPD